MSKKSSSYISNTGHTNAGLSLYYPPHSTSSDVPRKSDTAMFDMNTVIPRKPKKKIKIAPPLPWVVSQSPQFIIRIPKKDISFPRAKRQGKKRSYNYDELDNFDDDLQDTDDESSPKSKKRIKNKTSGSSSKRLKKSSSTLTDEPAAPAQQSITPAHPDPTSTNVAALIDPTSTESPPPGVLNCLWYSRECVLHVWVLEKVLGWKRRPVTTLQYGDDDDEADEDNVDPSNQANPSVENDHQKKMKKKVQNDGHLDQSVALSYHDHVVALTIKHSNIRHEVSRINASACPMVLRYAAEKEKLSCGNKTPKFRLASLSQETEEVYFVKWRGRSYIHCSWERKKDLEKFDIQAKVKLKRFHQLQEQVIGKQWKNHYLQLQSQASDSSTSMANTNGMAASTTTTEEDYFSSDNVEPERILACDETEVDLKILAKQRALNLQAEIEALERREHESPSDEQIPLLKHDDQYMTLLKMNEKSILNYVEDPEDNVRYVVKWKGQAFADVTWEYWRDIKHDAVDKVEDFWYRQKPPPLEPLKAHPHMRDYKKLIHSPVFGISTKARPVANLSNNTGKGEEGTSVEEPDSNSALALKLRAYQLEGVNWLLWNWWNKRSCILADEMGLGKTIQTMCFLDRLHQLSSTQVRGPFLVVAPLSLVNQWQSESMTWAPDMNVVLYHGSADARDYLVQQEFYYTDQFVHPKSLVPKYKRYGITKFHILITTYEVVLKDIAVLSKIKWRALIVDEAHRLKNNKSRLFTDLVSVPRDFCLLLTGTPLQNSTEELWALLHFSDPKTFGSKEEFVEKFGQLTDSKQVSELHSVLKPYLLRRVKEDVEKSLPPKEETILEVTLTPIQKTYYKAIYEKNTTFLFKGAKSGNAPSLMNVMMELRKCCNHPFLIKGAEERIMIDAATQEMKKNPENQGQQEDPQLVLYKRFAQQLVKSSGKMVLLEKLMPKLQTGGHKVLIFSQMVRVLDLLEEFLRLKHYKYERLDGSTGSSSRAAAVDRFNRKSFDRFVMLLSTRAGGLGLNLTSADTVIIFDSDWNPQNDLQAMARAHRIGQTRAVSVYRLLTKKTYEMHMFHSASMKLGLDRAVLAHQRQQESGANDSEGQITGTSGKKNKTKSEKEMQAKEIDELLKKGAYDVFRDEDDTEAQKFMETDIDQLLERSARKVTYGNTNTGISSGLGSFSKASFVTADADGNDVDLDDPDFWAKAVGLDAPTDQNIDENLLLDGEKRSRKQVQVFDPYAAYAEAEQKKKDKIAQKEKEEKEERDRIRSLKKKKKKQDNKKKIKKDKDSDSKNKSSGSISTSKKGSDNDRTKTRKDKDSKSKKARRAERQRAARKAEHEYPVIEQIKQGWETAQRNRAISAMVKYGFGRFCKIRNDANLTSLPIQDLEVFIRSYIYLLGIHSSVSFLATMYSKFAASPKPEIEISASCERHCSNMLDELSLHFRNQDQMWVLDAMKAAVSLHSEIRNRRRTLRIPISLMEPDFISELRSGSAFETLQRLAFLARFNVLIEGALDRVIGGFGNEELGKRGCPTKDLSTLDVDLKARHVTSEELCYALGEELSGCFTGFDMEHTPALWWDRSCDLALLVGTFIHGLSRYNEMFKDDELPFGNKIKHFLEESSHGGSSFQNLHVAVKVVGNAYQSLSSSLDSKKNTESSAKSTEKVKTDGTATSSENKSTLKLDNLGKTQEKYSSIIDLPSLSVQIQRYMNEYNVNHDKSESKPDDLSTSLVIPSPRSLDKRLQLLVDSFHDFSSQISTQKYSNCCLESYSSNMISDTWKSIVISNTKLMKRVCSLISLSHSIDKVEEKSSNIHGFKGFADFSHSSHLQNLLKLSNMQTLSKQLVALGIPTSLNKYGLCAILNSDHRSLSKVCEIEKKHGEKSEKKKSVQTEKGTKEVKNRVNGTTQDEEILTVDMQVFVYDLKFLPSTMRLNSAERGSLCASLFCFGSPVEMDKFKSRQVNDNLKNISFPSNHNRDFNVFNFENLLSAADRLAGTEFSIERDDARRYIQHILLPHCIRLCLKGVKVEEDISNLSKFGKISALFENKMFLSFKSILPDPLMSLKNHSEESIAFASAIVRRVRLTRSIRCIVGDGVQLHELDSFLRSSKLRSDMKDMPLWWCPWTHDIALMVHVARFGLFSILVDIKNDEKLQQLGSVFAFDNIKSLVTETLLEGINGQRPLIPKHVLDTLSNDELDDLITYHSNQFPSARVIECRLCFICGQLTQNGLIVENKNNTNCKYYDMPLFDQFHFLN